VQRLKTRAQFQAVMAAGIVARTAHFALHRMQLGMPQAITRLGSEGTSATSGSLPHSPKGPGSEGPAPLFAVRNDAWMGVLLPKRWAKRAVTRNTIKRQVYSVSASLQPPLPAAAHVVRLRAGFDRTQFASATSDALRRAVRGELLELFDRAAA
jgi:ribonuclease P protein component